MLRSIAVACCAAFIAAGAANAAAPPPASAAMPNVPALGSDPDRANSSIDSALRTLLAGQPWPSWVTEGEARAALEFYRARQFRPLWTRATGLTARARRVLAQLASAGDDGLRPDDYLPSQLDAFADSAAALAGDHRALARLEAQLAAAALRYARHASGGRLVPAQADRRISLEPETVAPDEVLQALAASARPDRVLADLLPRLPQYGQLRAELARLRLLRDEAPRPPVAAGPTIRPGDRDPRVVEIRRRLIDLGFYVLETSENTAPDDAAAGAAVQVLASPLYDDTLVAATRRFQDSRGLAPDALIGPATLAALNADNDDRAATLIVNLERMRWLPDNLGERHLFVDQAGFELRLIDAGAVVHTARVIIGKPSHPTPMFSHQLDHIVLNPYWNVPRSIAREEMLPELVADPAYLDARGFEVFWFENGKRRRIESARVDWWNVSARQFHFYFRQPPGPENALGRLKFMFPNRHNIYLHDTPAKNLFASAARAFSHGCVRVQDPERLAELLLGADQQMTPAKLERLIATGRNMRINLNKKVPIHLAYFTAWPQESGQIGYRRDIYRRDAAVERALAAVSIAMK